MQYGAGTFVKYLLGIYLRVQTISTFGIVLTTRILHKINKKIQSSKYFKCLRVRCEQRKSLASENRSRQNIFEAREAESGSACDCASERDHLLLHDKNIFQKPLSCIFRLAEEHFQTFTNHHN